VAVTKLGFPVSNTLLLWLAQTTNPHPAVGKRVTRLAGHSATRYNPIHCVLMPWEKRDA
jgi:hypothetical protein